MRSRRVLLLIVAVVMLSAVAGAAVTSLQRPSPPFRSSVVATQADGALFGVHLDVGADPLDAYAERLGRTPAVIGVFVQIPLRDQDRAVLDDAAGQASAAGAAMMVTLEPHDGLAAVDEGARERLTGWLSYWNERGVPILVRYAHEMNGSWYPWGQQPAAYVDSFRRVADAVRDAPDSEIVWAPNEGTGYPFTDGPGAVVASRAEPGAESDPGTSTPLDPYAPYYPGDDYVDWVGLTLYHFGDAPPWERNVGPDEGKFLARIRGKDRTTGTEPGRVPDFHAQYVIGRGKPFVLAETAALYVPGRPREASEVEIKSAWAAQVFAPDIPAELPGLDLVMWFEYAKEETAVPGVTSDWTVTRNPEVRDAFRDLFPPWLEFAPVTTPRGTPP